MSHAPSADTSRSLESSATDAPQLDALVLADQMGAVRRSVLIAIPVNMLLGFANLFVAFDHHRYRTAVLWFGMSTLVNVWRIHLCRQRVEMVQISGPRIARNFNSNDAMSPVVRQLRRFSFGALMSGFVWAGVPLFVRRLYVVLNPLLPHRCLRRNGGRGDTWYRLRTRTARVHYASPTVRRGVPAVSRHF